MVLAELHRPSCLKQRERSQRQVCAATLEAVGVTVAPEDVLFICHGQIQKTSSGKLQCLATGEAYERKRIRVATPMELRVDWMRLRARRFYLHLSTNRLTVTLR